MIALMMEAVRSSETSFYFDTTWRYIPESYNFRYLDEFRYQQIKGSNSISISFTPISQVNVRFSNHYITFLFQYIAYE
jgi:hypothetical protein